MRKMMRTSRPFWTPEGANIVETAMVEIDTDGAEYRDGQQGKRAAVSEAPDGAEEAKNNPDGAE